MIDIKETKAVISTAANVELLGIPSLLKASLNGPTQSKAEKDDIRNPANVTPICTEEKKNVGSSNNFLTRPLSALGPNASSMSSLSVETTEISVAAK